MKSSFIPYRSAATAMIALALAACAQTAPNPPAPGTLAAQQDRISDGVIDRDYGVYRETQQRIKALNDGGRRVADYQLSKAQCWLDVSFHEYSRNDRGGFPQAALSESQRIIGALEAGQDAGWATPLVNHAEKLRPDLWARYDALKQAAGFSCAAQQTACGEVELVHAGNEIHDAGWRHAKPYIQIAEDLAGGAEKSAAGCGTPPKPIVAVQPEKITLSADALFQFDKSDSKDLLPKGRAELDDLAQKLATRKVTVTAIKVTGYTDRLGSAAYNQRLSLARANTVKRYLQDHGVTAPIGVEGRGLQDQLVACTGVKPRPALLACLQPNRRVEVTISAE
ncbi:OmpA family protein [Collimonas pratensis]|uniref:OmpA family protein n=1 Tax=Collimonas pratensis TaxID=279113 RepID=UPI00143CF1BB|nr:OmpA family protein [Collimonas pratensis]NKI69482.1 OmpA family protein [Collimonas pratensis]